MRITIITGLMVGIATVCHAMPVHMFPGIDQLIQEAQHIAVITIIEHISGDGQGYDEYHVWVRRTLKGAIPEDKTTAISLAHLPYSSTNGIGTECFVNYHSYVVFLQDNQPPVSKAPYRNLQTVGSSWEASLPHPDWRPDPNSPIRDTIKMLMNENLQSNEQVLAGQRAMFNEIFEDKNAPPPASDGQTQEIVNFPKHP